MNAQRRHTLVWPTPAAWTRLRRVTRDETVSAAFARWEIERWPLVVRRAEGGSTALPGTATCGLALPPGAERRRLCVDLDRGEVERQSPPLPLASVVDALPGDWRACARDLVRGASTLEMQLRVFGSAAWQALTGLAYVHDASDLDLLIAPRGSRDIERAIGLFERIGSVHGRRIDGEIVFPDGGAVAWREWRVAGRAARVLVKHRDRVTLEPCADLLAQFGALRVFT
jgi:phosphoribosyl-dephospho-CoA transferase